MSKMSQLDAELRELFCPDGLLPPRPENLDAALALLEAIQRVNPSISLPLFPMAKAKTPQAYEISYTVRDGDNEYKQSITEYFDHEPGEDEIVTALAENYGADNDQVKVALKEFHEGWTGTPDESIWLADGERMAVDIAWGKA